MYFTFALLGVALLAWLYALVLSTRRVRSGQESPVITVLLFVSFFLMPVISFLYIFQTSANSRRDTGVVLPVNQTISFAPTRNKAVKIIGTVVGTILIGAGVLFAGFVILIMVAIAQCSNDPKCM